MTIYVEFLLARHPRLLLFGEACVECLDSGSILTAIGGCGRNIHPLFAVECARHKLANEKCRREISVHDKAHVLLFTAHKATADVVTRIAEVDVHIVPTTDTVSQVIFILGTDMKKLWG